MRRLRGLGLMVIASAALSGCDKPGYSDCIAEHMQGTGSDVAAHEIRRACQRIQAFNKSDNLTEEQFAALKVLGRFVGDRFELTVHNGNSNIVVTALVVQLETNYGDKTEKNNYALRGRVEPFETAELQAKFLGEKPKEGGPSFALVGARGYGP